MDYDDKFNLSFLNDNEYENKKALQDVKSQTDKRYHTLTKRIMVNENFYKNIKIELHGSGDIGCTIRNAETGEYYKGHLVGSSNEDLYFKVSHSIKPNLASKNYVEQLTLFYLSPEHYERHQHVELDNSIKIKWNSKREKYLQKEHKV